MREVVIFSIPLQLVGGHPFSVPGLAIGLTDNIYIEEIRKTGFYDQAFAVLFLVRAVGVMVIKGCMSR